MFICDKLRNSRVLKLIIGDIFWFIFFGDLWMIDDYVWFMEVFDCSLNIGMVNVIFCLFVIKFYYLIWWEVIFIN